MSKLSSYIYIAILMIVVGMFRGIGLFYWKDLDFDEIITTTIAMLPLDQIWSYVRYEMHPPLHFYTMYAWIQLFGNGEIAMRWSSIVFNLFMIPASYILGVIGFKSRRAGIVMATLSGTIAIFVLRSLVIRMEILLSLLAIFSHLFFLLFYYKKNRTQSFIAQFGYIITTTLLLYTHITAIFIPLTHVLTLLYAWYANNKSLQIKPWLITIATPLILYLPWFLHFLKTRFIGLESNAWYFLASHETLPWFAIPFKLLFRMSLPPFAEMITFLFFVCLATMSIIKITQFTRKSITINYSFSITTVLGLLTLIVPILILSTIGLHSIRYYILSAIGFMMLIAGGCIQFQSIKTFRLVLTGIISMLIIPSFMVIYSLGSNWSNVAKYIKNNQQPGDRIITAFIAENFALSNYYDGGLPVDTFITEKDKKHFSNDPLLTAVKGNIYLTVDQSNINEFGNLIGESKNVFFVYNPIMFGKSYELYTRWFLDNGWKRTDYLKTSSQHDRQVWYLTKP